MEGNYDQGEKYVDLDMSIRSSVGSTTQNVFDLSFKLCGGWNVKLSDTLPAIHSIRINEMKYFSKHSGDIHSEFYY